jgi:hypothetical protein
MFCFWLMEVTVFVPYQMASTERVCSIRVSQSRASSQNSHAPNKGNPCPTVCNGRLLVKILLGSAIGQLRMSCGQQCYCSSAHSRPCFFTSGYSMRIFTAATSVLLVTTTRDYTFCYVLRWTASVVSGYRSKGPGSIPGATRFSEK